MGHRIILRFPKTKLKKLFRFIIRPLLYLKVTCPSENAKNVLLLSAFFKLNSFCCFFVVVFSQKNHLGHRIFIPQKWAIKVKRLRSAGLNSVTSLCYQCSLITSTPSQLIQTALYCVLTKSYRLQ